MEITQRSQWGASPSQLHHNPSWPRVARANRASSCRAVGTGMLPGEKRERGSLPASSSQEYATHGAAGGESVPPPLPPRLASAGLRVACAFSTTSIPTCHTRPAASLGAPTGVVLPEPRETERTGNTAGPTWVCQPGQQPVSRTVFSGALRTSLRRTAGTPPRPHARRTRFLPDRDSNSSVTFLRCLCPHPCLSAEANRISLGSLRRLVSLRTTSKPNAWVHASRQPTRPEPSGDVRTRLLPLRRALARSMCLWRGTLLMILRRASSDCLLQLVLLVPGRSQDRMR